MTQYIKLGGKKQIFPSACIIGAGKVATIQALKAGDCQNAARLHLEFAMGVLGEGM
jgi:hypothetical protein